jgi:hypothetical protein
MPMIVFPPIARDRGSRVALMDGAHCNSLRYDHENDGLSLVSSVHQESREEPPIGRSGRVVLQA